MIVGEIGGHFLLRGLASEEIILPFPAFALEPQIFVAFELEFAVSRLSLDVSAE
jgi:hypothetical protein